MREREENIWVKLQNWLTWIGLIIILISVFYLGYSKSCKGLAINDSTNYGIIIGLFCKLGFKGLIVYPGTVILILTCILILFGRKNA